MTLAEQITHLRKERKMSQEELAEALQISRQSVSKWETGMSNPDTENLIRLAEIFQVDVNLLIGSQMEPEEKPAQPVLPHDQRKTVRILSLFLVLSVCLCGIFAGLWLGEKGNKNSDGVETEGETKMWWDSLKMYTGLMRKEVALSSAEKKAIVDYITGFHFAEKSKTTENDNDYMTGGRKYYIEYATENICFQWYFSETGFSCVVFPMEGERTIHCYEVDYMLLYELDAYASNNKEG